MSRSRRNEPVTGITTAETEKQWKRQANRRLRRCSTPVIQRVSVSIDPDELVLPIMHEVVNQYDGPKDGRQRFDPERYPTHMRK